MTRKSFTTTSAALLCATYLGSGSASAQSVRQLESACYSGNMGACDRLYYKAQVSCQNGDRQACNYAADMAREFGDGEPEYPGAVQSPTAPYRPTINEATGYINSKCKDPNLAMQLRAYGFCR